MGGIHPDAADEQTFVCSGELDVTDPTRPMISLPASAFSPGEMYLLLRDSVLPRPVAWVSTVSTAGVPNLAPHSYTTIFSTDPPVIGFVSVGRKDSLNNAEAGREFVLNIASQSLMERLNLTAANFPPGEDEFRWAELTHVPSDIVTKPKPLLALNHFTVASTRRPGTGGVSSRKKPGRRSYMCPLNV